MKLNRIKFSNHHVLGDLEVDFCVGGSPASTILIAGENGAGKTSILNAIYDLASPRPQNVRVGENVAYTVSLSEDEARVISNHSSSGVPTGAVIDDEIVLEFTGVENSNWERIKILGSIDGSPKEMVGAILADPLVKGSFRFLYSNVAINFDPKPISSVTAKNIDEVGASQVTGPLISTEITQLLIDIQALDDADLSKWVRENKNQVVGEGVLDQRISRFKQAFSLMFPAKEYKEIINEGNRKKVIFTEGGKDCFIEDLSSGEKQIVFRGGFFLKDVGSLKGTVSIIDEPEISLHPNWQLRIIEFYKSVLALHNQNNHSQMIVATHSPFILHNYDRLNDKIIVLKKNEEGNIAVSEAPSFHGWTHEKAISEAFSIELSETFDKPIVLVEGETDEKYINTAAIALGIDLQGIEVKWVGRIAESGNAEFTGDKALNHTLAFTKSNPSLITRPLVLLYDSDTKKPVSNHNNIVVRRMPFCKGNQLMKKGIENLLSLPADLDITQFHDEKTKIDDYGTPSTIRVLNKNKLCDSLIENPTAELFENFKGIFTVIINTVKDVEKNQ